MGAKDLKIEIATLADKLANVSFVLNHELWIDRQSLLDLNDTLKECSNQIDNFCKVD